MPRLSVDPVVRGGVGWIVRRPRRIWAGARWGGLLVTAIWGGCDDGSDPADEALRVTDLRYASHLVEFVAGENAGFGQDGMPAIVLGAPSGSGPIAGGHDVLSLGVGGHVVLGFDIDIVDGPGDDLLVFENAFWPDGNPDSVFAELAEVSVSEDGETWHTFACSLEPVGVASWPGCAGYTPVAPWDKPHPELPRGVGGEGFDLADLSLSRARFVRVLDLAQDGAGNSAGFDLDAIGVLHWQER